ncbi:MAG: uroporphyrinogen-III C-methyltransferase [Aquabacterium sp.]|uniref:uroporphyrinogen-III C-methyltransferase n=1 Tax=Aquabacterium sp. TaxID=1872578 RepID=UPI00120F2A1C|nr:uroporphyrinogen-III C-methyltransferase [Aquabacterium sp.]TAK92549.1 MAG: uroporphyrinogen-III C-methyltransferase [Aquabacterium sp.]
MAEKPCSLVTAKVVFIGAGPGEADLITVRGSRLLAQAQVVLFDALADASLRDLAPQAEWIDVGKRGFSGKEGSDFNGQTRINQLLVEQSLAVGAIHGERGLVARLKGGDPSLFGRLEEELHALREAGIDSEVVPGVTSALAAAAATQRPLTRRGTGRSVSFTTAMTRTGDLQCGMGPGQRADTEVFYMAGRQLDPLSKGLLDAGWPAETTVSVVSRAGWPDMRHTMHTVGTLGDASSVHAGRPTLVIVGAGATDLPEHPLTHIAICGDARDLTKS